MFYKAKIPITTDTYRTSKPFLFVSRLLGLYPVLVNKKKTQLYLKWSFLFTIYSYVLGIFILGSNVYGLYQDVIDEKHSTRAKSLIQLFVIVVEIFLTDVILIYAIFINSVRLGYYFKFTKYIQEVDNVIPPTRSNQEQRYSIFMIVGLTVSTWLVLIVDLLAYNRKHSNLVTIRTVSRYWSFYVATVMVALVQFQFWFTSRMIMIRVTKLNETLKSNFTKLKQSNGFQKKAYHINVVKFRKIEERTEMTSNQFLQLVGAYIKLHDSAYFLDLFWGPTVSVLITSNVWKLIESPFFLLVELVRAETNHFVVAIEIVRLIYFFLRLVILVEPANSCVVQSEEINNLIAEMLSSVTMKSKLKLELETFSNVLLHCKIEFNVAGLTTLSRALITSVLGAVSTYLIILIQYRND